MMCIILEGRARECISKVFKQRSTSGKYGKNTDLSRGINKEPSGNVLGKLMKEQSGHVVAGADRGKQ